MEHESCGVGAVVDLDGGESHQIVSDALTIVERLAHRAGCDALGTTGDGVGILTQIPHGLFRRWAKEAGVELGDKRDYGVAMLFLPAQEEADAAARHVLEATAQEEGLRVLGWRSVPCRPGILGEGARRTMPGIAQCFIARPQDVARGLEFDRRLYALRRCFEKKETGAYVCSLSSRTIVYKGMMLVTQLRSFYDDLRDADYTSALAMVHSRFS
ncbi:MAG: glutamate synthase subunit alpha, partial [bacterium]|nr:glutamate synthase subunit alpha [bacterium]